MRRSRFDGDGVGGLAIVFVGRVVGVVEPGREIVVVVASFWEEYAEVLFSDEEGATRGMDRCRNDVRGGGNDKTKKKKKKKKKKEKSDDDFVEFDTARTAKV